MYKPSDREAALLLLRALEERGQRRGKQMTRARISGMTLRQLWNREQLTEPWLDQVNEWLLSAGWTLINAGKTFGAVRTDVVENWPRVASKHLKAETDRVKLGTFEFAQLEHLLQPQAAVPKLTQMKRAPKRKTVTRLNMRYRARDKVKGRE